LRGRFDRLARTTTDGHSPKGNGDDDATKHLA
jgi:hypothetical protein